MSRAEDRALVRRTSPPPVVSACQCMETTADECACRDASGWVAKRVRQKL